MLESTCNGCITEHPSHVATYVYVRGGEAELNVNKHYLKLLFIETCITLWLNPRLVDFDNTLLECLQWWVGTDFQDLEMSLNVEAYVVT
jgi:hypothetical protein